MKIKTKDLTGAALDWVVAKCEGYDTAFASAKDVIILREGVTDYFDPHRNWGWGGPILDRERITIRQWTGMPIIHAYMPHDGAPWGAGPTPLIAAMRCYVISKLGNEVDVPEELM